MFTSPFRPAVRPRLRRGPTPLLLSLVLLAPLTPALAAAEPSKPATGAAPSGSTQENPLSVHVLDLQTGQPRAGIRVTLAKRQGSEWLPLAEAQTDEQGRVRALLPARAVWTSGDYRVVFHTGEFYARLRQPSFFPEIPVIFHVADARQHYHIPLLLSPYGYSTYRGN